MQHVKNCKQRALAVSHCEPPPAALMIGTIRGVANGWDSSPQQQNPSAAAGGYWPFLLRVAHGGQGAAIL